MPVTKSLIRKERRERSQDPFLRKFPELFEIDPVHVADVAPGSICRLWWMPNQTWFVVVGVTDEMVKIVHAGGQVGAFSLDALVVVMRPPPADFPDLVVRIETFENQLVHDAWCGRKAYAE